MLQFEYPFHLNFYTTSKKITYNWIGMFYKIYNYSSRSSHIS